MTEETKTAAKEAATEEVKAEAQETETEAKPDKASKLKSENKALTSAEERRKKKREYMRTHTKVRFLPYFPWRTISRERRFAQMGKAFQTV